MKRNVIDSLTSQSKWPLGRALNLKRPSFQSCSMNLLHASDHRKCMYVLTGGSFKEETNHKKSPQNPVGTEYFVIS